MIEVKDLQKEFLFKRKDLGINQSLKNLFVAKREVKNAVNGISFSISEGEIVGFLGPNGAGKTTTLKMLSGILYPSSGEALILGYVPWERKNEFKKQISIVLGQKNQLWWDLPANESLYLNKCIYGIEDNAYQLILDELCELLDVRRLLDIQVRNLSLGERMKMELIAALLHKPKVIFLDEPTIGLDMIAQKNIRDFLKRYNENEKTTIILTSHYLEDIENLCERAIVINHGYIVYDGKLKTINEKLAQKKLIKVKTNVDLTKSLNPKCPVSISKEGYWILEVQKNNVQQIMIELLNQCDVKDFSVEDIPLEESLEILYRQ